jgi:curli biogenesis system outer membrane secretion channel CsgG
MAGFDVLERGNVLTLQQEIQLKRKSHPLNGSNSVVIGQPKSSTLKKYAQIA